MGRIFVLAALALSSLAPNLGEASETVSIVGQAVSVGTPANPTPIAITVRATVPAHPDDEIVVTQDGSPITLKPGCAAISIEGSRAVYDARATAADGSTSFVHIEWDTERFSTSVGVFFGVRTAPGNGPCDSATVDDFDHFGLGRFGII